MTPEIHHRAGLPAAMVVVEYGCVKCQLYHAMGDLLYHEHLMFQSKHGLRTRQIGEIYLPQQEPSEARAWVNDRRAPLDG